MSTGNWLIAILCLGLLMIVHEGGHYLAARAFGMRVITFSIGFGPAFFRIVPKDGYFWFCLTGDKIRIRLWKHDPEKHGPTVYQVAMLPFFAYVNIAGMNPFEEIDPKDKGSYANASVLGRISAIFAGPFANYAFASVLFFAAFFFGGRAVLPTNVNIVEGRPAAAAGLKDGDRIVEIAGVKVDEWEQMAGVIAARPGQTIPVVVERDQERLTLTVTTANEAGAGKIGVMAKGPANKVPVTAKEAGYLAITRPPIVVKELVVGMWQFLSGKVEGELGGPVRIVQETARAAESGWTELLIFLGILSAYLGAFNLLPFPALDGGRLMFLGIEAATRRRANAKIEARIHAIGFVLLLSLVLYVTFAKDLPRAFMK
ncbi:MAG: site-2 protease family protein [Polyangiaceae bacterium]|nr:site-2 protease family protein [Polyangiaceae bacterium]